ncbi:MAG: putative bifunctional diguanylate cyclase/phosphodiesterase [Actinomycetales bacterium]
MRQVGILHALARAAVDVVGADWAEVNLAGSTQVVRYPDSLGVTRAFDPSGAIGPDPAVVETEVPIEVSGLVVARLTAQLRASSSLGDARALLLSLAASAAERWVERAPDPAQLAPLQRRLVGTGLLPRDIDVATGLLAALDRMPFGLVLVRPDPSGWQAMSTNPALAAMRNVTRDRSVGPLDVVIGSMGRLDPVELSAQTATNPITRRLQREDGSTFDAWLYCVALGPGGVATHALCVLDVDAQSRRLRELDKLAMTDPVTGLANRTRVTVILERCLTDDPPRSVAVMLLDLDRFKNVNDSLGHQVGDELLIEVTRRLRAAVPDGTVVARLGGDEFLLVLRGLEDVLDVHPVAYGLLEELNAPFELRSGHRVATSVSIGVAIADRDDHQAVDLIREADLAMYRAKDLGRNRYALCDEGMLQEADDRLGRELVLRRGLEERRLRLRLQPIVDLRTGKLAEYEALVRLEDPELGEVGPDQFIPIAEETGLISQIDYWVLEESLEQFTSLPRLTDSGVRIAVNVSGRTLEAPDFISRLVVALHRNNVDASRLAIEITESCLLGDNPAILWTLNQLRARGAHVAIDDFGTGYSALSYLQNFEVDLLKIDQSFIKRVSPADQRGTDLVGNIVQLAHDLGLKVVAEGVEDEAQASLLGELGCDLAQGWFFGRPVEPLDT